MSKTTDATADPSTATPETTIEDKFYPPKPDAKVEPSPTNQPSETPAPAGAVKTEAAPDPADEDEPLDPKSKSPRNSWAEMRTARYRAEAEAELLREQLAEQRKAASLPAAPAEQPERIGKPRSEDFETHDEYLDARDAFNRTEWIREGEESARAAEEEKATKAQEEKSAKLKESWEAREAVVKVTHAAYDENFEAFFTAARNNQPLATAVFESPVGPDLAQQLGSTPEELARLLALEPRFMLRAIGVLEDAIAKRGKGSTHHTQAPRPIGSVSGPASRPAKATTMEDRLYPD